MITQAPEQALDETLGKLEKALLAPVVSGELKSWVTNVRQAAATFAVDWTRYLHSVLHLQYQEIAQTDPELLSEVEKMIQTDQQLLEKFARFHEELQTLEKNAEKVEWQENKLTGEQKRIEETGISLILQIKKQRAAAETWLSESLYRDRGVKD
jgi:exonuclease VII large subunit